MVWNGIDIGSILTMILQMVLAIAIPALVAFVFSEGRSLLAYVRENYWAKLTAEQQATVEGVAHVAVNMAEQIAKREDVQDAAKVKFNMANAYMNSQLQKLGITLTAEEIEAQIEAAVRSELNPTPPAPPQASAQAPGA